MGRIVAGVIFILGLWIFLFPFTGPVMGLSLVPAAQHMGMMHMGGNMGNTPVIVVNRAMVFSNFIPGALLMCVGVYALFSRAPQPAFA